MKKILSIALLFVCMQTMAQEKLIVNDANAQKREVGEFKAIKISGGIDLLLKQGDEVGVAVSAKDLDDRDDIKTEVEDGVLKIYFKNTMGWTRGDKKLRAYVSFKTLEKLTASGACDTELSGVLTVPDFELEISGASDFKGDVKIENLLIKQSGASDVKISGSATHLKITCSGASDCKAYDLRITNCDASASGASDIRVNVQTNLKAHASGASSIFYKGNPTQKDVSESGASEVKQRD
jgi:Putative auto-transporter adhesin, head GIN domain